MELDIYTGQLIYKDIDFSFVFDGNELRLIPQKEESKKIHEEWIMKPLGKGIYTMGDPLEMDSPYLVGKCNENGHTMIFLTRKG